jgi:hypothetical protein
MKSIAKTLEKKYGWKKGDVSVEFPENLDKKSEKPNLKKESLKQALSLLQNIIEGFDEDE